LIRISSMSTPHIPAPHNDRIEWKLESLSQDERQAHEKIIELIRESIDAMRRSCDSDRDLRNQQHTDLMAFLQTMNSGMDNLREAVEKTEDVRKRWEDRFQKSDAEWQRRHERLEREFRELKELTSRHSSNWARVGAILTPARAVLMAVITAAAIALVVGPLRYWIES